MAFAVSVPLANETTKIASPDKRLRRTKLDWNRQDFIDRSIERKPGQENATEGMTNKLSRSSIHFHFYPKAFSELVLTIFPI